jgi:hypothetical protein
MQIQEGDILLTTDIQQDMVEAHLLMAEPPQLVVETVLMEVETVRV